MLVKMGILPKVRGEKVKINKYLSCDHLGIYDHKDQNKTDHLQGRKGMNYPSTKTEHET